MTNTPALPTSKREKIIYLLDHWDDIHDPNATAPQGANSSGGAHLLPLMSRHPSVLELTRTLAALKLEQPRWHDHVKAYHAAEWRIKTRYATKKRKGGKQETIILRDRHRATPQWLKIGYVHAGHTRLAELFQGDVYIPGELWDALTMSSQDIEAKQRRRSSARVAA